MLSVLVIDDELGARTLLAMALAGADVRVETAGTGAEALKLLRDTPFDWVVSDVRLPDTSGITLTQEILQARPNAQVILMSAVVSDDEITSLPIIAFWRKPFDPLALRQFILGNRQAGAQAPPAPLGESRHHRRAGAALRPPHLLT